MLVTLLLALTGSAGFEICNGTYPVPSETTRLDDYRAPEFSVEEGSLNLYFNISGPDLVTVDLSANLWSLVDNPTLVLDGSHELDLVTLSLTINFDEINYCVDTVYSKIVASNLNISKGTEIHLSSRVKINPSLNTQLFGLYVSNGLLVTQNEAQGFRKITYFFDRPDVLSDFKVTIEADKADYPVILSNGNKQQTLTGQTDRHTATFVDPMPKPTYLFALVAGKLKNLTAEVQVGRPCLQAVGDLFNTSQPEDHKLAKFCSDKTKSSEPRGIQVSIWSTSETDRLRWALRSIEKSILWDEIVYGRFYDLEEFHIVAVKDFNAGAMENKGLNIFNIALVEADRWLSTDADFIRVQGVIGHEYFHNWSGDRVTVRDWFQLSLKEGFTVFRDQQFTQDLMESDVKRIEDVKFLKDVQFIEDASSLSHPIRPDAYKSIENFYTVTVYEKGAEIVRMYQTLLGDRASFREATDYYFERNDHKAVTCEDFFDAMNYVAKKNNNLDLTQFFKWYNVAGTPLVEVVEQLDYGTVFELSIKQTTSTGEPMMIPLVFGLVDKETGQDLIASQVLILNQTEQTFEISKPNTTKSIISVLNRGFSAPIDVKPYQTLDETVVLAKYDSCDYIRWNSGQEIYAAAVLGEYRDEQNSDEYVIDLVTDILADHRGEGINSYRLRFPPLNSYEAKLGPSEFDPQKLYEADQTVKKRVLKLIRPLLLEKLSEIDLKTQADYEINSGQIDLRMYKAEILRFLAVDKTDYQTFNIIRKLLEHPRSESEAATALYTLVSYPFNDELSDALQLYFKRAESEDLLYDRWLSALATSSNPVVQQQAVEIAKSEEFRNSTTPNRIRALVGGLASNTLFFNTNQGYAFIADEILRIDKFNPKVAARIATKFAKLNK